MQFVVLGFDGDDDDAPARRQETRPKHLARGDELRDAGNLWYAAALLGDDGSMKGSMYLVDFDSEAAMREWLESEPYVVGKVWHRIEIRRASVREPWQFSRPQEFFAGRS
jgi:uncharacterized protein YciI